MDCGGQFLKFLVFFFNAIVFISGCVMGGYGIFLLVEATETAGTVSIILPAFITTFGLLLFVIGFLGCFGACYNNTCMLKTFAVIVGVLLVCEVICAVLLLVKRHDFVEIVEKELIKLIHDIEDSQLGPNNPSATALHKLQKELKCCGGTGPVDWQTPPSSCCKKSSGPQCQPYQTGCAKAMYNEVKDSALVVGIVILVIALIQIGAIVCACCLANKVNEYEKV